MRCYIVRLLPVLLVFALVLPMSAWLFLQDSIVYPIIAVGLLLAFVMLSPLLYKMNPREVLLDDQQNIHLERLRRSEEEYRLLAANLPVAVIRYDAQQRRRYINPAAEKMLHGNATEMLGQVPGEGGVPALPAMIERYRSRMAEVLATGEIREFEFVLDALPEDQYEYFHVRMAPEYGDNGKITGTLTTWFDVTERRRMLEALAESERVFKSLAENLPDNIARWDTQGCYLYVNPTHEKVLGKSLEELVGSRIPDSHEQVNAAIAHVVSTGKANHAVRQAAMVGGVEQLHDVDLVPEFDETGKLVSVLGIGRDMTERYRMLDAIAAREQAFRNLAESTPDSIIRADCEGRILYLNGSLVRALDLNSVSDVLGFRASEIWTDGRFDAIEQAATRAIKTGEKQRFEINTRRLNGELACNQIFVVPERDVHGEIVGIIAFGRDITEIKQAEILLQERYERIAELNDRLEDQACELKASQVHLEQALGFTNDVINAIPDIMFETDHDGRYLNVWTHNLDALPAHKAVLIGKTVQDILPKDIAAQVITAIREADEQGVSYGRMLPIQQVNGETRWYEHTVSKKRSDHQGKLTFLVISRDVTERKRMEQALAEREHEFRTLVENSVDTVARYGPDLRRLYVNPAFAALIEGGAERLLGQTPSECPGGANAIIYEKKLAEVFAEGQGVEFEQSWPDDSGRQVCSLIKLTPEFDVQGSVASVLAVGRDITELNVFREKIHQMAFYDSLTSLPNRALFNDRLRQMITDAAWHGQQAGIMMIDMDRFKAVNDTLGHAAGDRLLCETAKRLNVCVRAYDTVARLGGDEFAILVPELRSGDDLGRVASKVLAEFQKAFWLEGREFFVSCSIGIALFPSDSNEADDLLKYADAAMYSAKRAGRNNFRFYSPDLTNSAHDRLGLESDLRRVIERKELELFYQPKVNLSTGALIGSEALLRWHHPERGMVPPDTFISIAEDCGLIEMIGTWVLYEACRTASHWNGEGRSLHQVAINLSARQFQGGGLAETVRRAMEVTGCRAEWIELEITESLLLDDQSEVLDVLNQIKEMGISIAIDDFGTGYSALSYLARFPIGTLKIDRTFIGSITSDKYRAELVKAILSIARCLGQNVVAEGVETVEQADFLRDHGCHMAQGYLYGKPMPVAAFESIEWAQLQFKDEATHSSAT